MATNLNIEVSPLPRVEGHGDLVLDVKIRQSRNYRCGYLNHQGFLRLCLLAEFIPNQLILLQGFVEFVQLHILLRQ